MKILLVVTVIAVFTADGRDLDNGPEEQIITAEAKLLPGDTEGQGGLSLSGPNLDNQLEENPMERRLGKTLCRRKLNGRCVRRRKPCPGHLPSQTKPGKPYCEKFHRCCHQVEPPMVSTTTPAPFECTFPWFKLDDQCFLQANEWRNWSSARAWCKEQDPTADLAQPSNMAAMTDYLGYGGYWLGGSFQGIWCYEGVWTWLNGSTIEDGWYPGTPYCFDIQEYDYDVDYDCVYTETEYGANSLFNEYCGYDRNFICERPLP